MKRYIDKSEVVAEIEGKRKCAQHLGDNAINSSMQQFYDGMKQCCIDILSYLDTLEVKEVDLDALGVLAEHLIACDAHLVTPKYTDKELNLLEEWAKNNKTQKGEEV